MSRAVDFLVVGGGIVGLTIARELAVRRLGRVVVLEKESRLGMHSSGRNSGVLHAGIYYAADTIKARVCADGARRLRQYAAEHRIPLDKTGKVIVATSAETAPQIDVLFDRARANGIRVERVDRSRLAEIEPEARSHGDALYSPDTAVIDPRAVLEQLAVELRQLGVDLLLDARVLGVDGERRAAVTPRDRIAYGHLVNAAGLHADVIAHRLGVAERYRILPFKGTYKRLIPATAQRFRGSIYPAPDLRMPYLGLHITRGVDGSVSIGPTAIPVLGREHYRAFAGVAASELPTIASQLVAMYLKNVQGFRTLAHAQARLHLPGGFLGALRELAPRLEPHDIVSSTKVGIRAQLVDRQTLRLVMDFVIEDGPSSTHVLNAVSPAFTSSLSFAEMVVDRIEGVAAPPG